MDRFDEMAELRRTWTPPPELIGSVPREVRLSRAGITISILAGLLVAGGFAAAIMLQWVSRRESDEQSRLSQQGKDIEASVTRLWRSHDKESRPMVAYQFESGGRIYSTSVSAPLRVWQNLVPGSRLPVRYLPSNPAHNHPRDWVKSIMPLWLSVLLGLFLIGIGVGLALLLRRQLALLSEGQPAAAIVTRYSQGPHGKKNFHYEFALLSGSVTKGRGGPAQRPPAIGERICVIYDRENPRRNAVYPFEMARLEKMEGRPRR